MTLYIYVIMNKLILRMLLSLDPGWGGTVQYLRIHMILQELYKANTDTNLSHLDQKAEL